MQRLKTISVQCYQFHNLSCEKIYNRRIMRFSSIYTENRHWRHFICLKHTNLLGSTSFASVGNIFLSLMPSCLLTRFIGIQDCLHVTHIYFINLVEGVNPPVSEAHCGCSSFHKYVITIIQYYRIKTQQIVQFLITELFSLKSLF